ncbi:hypothetical protein AOE01nite_34080 [Acetobacter oeni]|uniref:Uncharacterized protein n=1 Tax=Acetobacter oeni TaxID=304077 RepID=A0A511XQH8_9PROT|nr:hypothetical protein AA21952_1932 [Acetobacter oeni LMG 21952]GEN65184.1 hypothetical protein AOE01nite_34080 [Acetobacter oeni]
MVAEGAADDDFGFKEILTDRCHAKFQLAVIQQEDTAGLRNGYDLMVRQINAGDVAWRIVEIEPELAAGLQYDPAIGKPAHTQFGTLNIGENPERTADLFFDLTHDTMAGRVVIMSPVGEIKAKHVRPGAGEIADRLSVRRGRTQSGNDFCSAMRGYHYMLSPRSTG